MTAHQISPRVQSLKAHPCQRCYFQDDSVNNKRVLNGSLIQVQVLHDDMFRWSGFHRSG